MWMLGNEFLSADWEPAVICLIYSVKPFAPNWQLKSKVLGPPLSICLIFNTDQIVFDCFEMPSHMTSQYIVSFDWSMQKTRQFIYAFSSDQTDLLSN